MMFNDKRTFRLIREDLKIMRHPRNTSRYKTKCIIKTAKHPDSVVVWVAFSGNKGKGDVLPKNLTMKANNYVNVL